MGGGERVLMIERIKMETRAVRPRATSLGKIVVPISREIGLQSRIPEVQIGGVTITSADVGGRV